MGRRFNRLMAAVYTRIPGINEMYVKLSGKKWQDRVEQPQLALPSQLSSVRVGLLTSAGVHLTSQRPFDMHNPEGDATVRVIPGDVSMDDITITHDYYDHAAADIDVNCVFPIERLRELAQKSMIRDVAPRHVGFMGHIFGRQQDELVNHTAGQVADMFLSDGVGAVLASPG
jgi:D-proline reductase (dithiol) PrdB